MGCVDYNLLSLFQCAAFIGEYGEQVLQLVDQAINPKEDCQVLRDRKVDGRREE